MSRRSAVAPSVVFLALFIPAIASATPYVLTDLGTLGGSTSQAFGINASGDVVGASSKPDGSTHGFLYSNGTMTDLGAFHSGAYSSYAYAVNSSKVVAGCYNTSAGSYFGVVDSGGTVTELGGLMAGGQSWAMAVNTSGEVAGYANTTNTGTPHPFRHTSAGGMVDLGTLGGATGYAFGINDSGQVVGRADIEEGGTRAFLYSNGTMTNLGTLPEGTYSSARAISHSGVAVGNSYSSSSPSTQHPVMFSGGSVTDLGSLGATGSANGINAAGVVVGWSKTADTAPQHAFVWDSVGGIRDLNSTSLVPGLGSWVLSYAQAINDAGQIVGYGKSPDGNTHAYRLAPALPGDATLDGTVDVADLNKVLTNYNQAGMQWGQGDFDGSGLVDVSDLNKVLTNYNKGVGAFDAGIEAVPEPGALALLAAGLIGLLGYAWRKGNG